MEISRRTKKATVRSMCGVKLVGRKKNGGADGNVGFEGNVG